MPDAEVIPIGEPRRSPSKTARAAGATGPKPRRTAQPPIVSATAPAIDVDVAAAADEHESIDVQPSGWEERLASALAFLRRRATGDYDVDEFGFDAEFTDNVIAPLLRPMYRTWWRVDTFGLENIPSDGAALVVANHSGTVAWDAAMTQLAIFDEHPNHRHLRMLGADFVFKMPFLGEVARKTGNTLACVADAERLLQQGNVVGVWPEGFKGIGKPFSERYRLQRFGRGGFVAAALRAKAPIIPTAIVGAEEIHPMLANSKFLARLTGVPYFPITPTFPWFGPLGMVPLPTKWTIVFGEPIYTDGFPEGSADDPMLLFNLTDQVRESIQRMLLAQLTLRKSTFR